MICLSHLCGEGVTPLPWAWERDPLTRCWRAVPRSRVQTSQIHHYVDNICWRAMKSLNSVNWWNTFRDPIIESLDVEARMTWSVLTKITVMNKLLIILKHGSIGSIEILGTILEFVLCYIYRLATLATLEGIGMCFFFWWCLSSFLDTFVMSEN